MLSIQKSKDAESSTDLVVFTTFTGQDDVSFVGVESSTQQQKKNNQTSTADHGRLGLKTVRPTFHQPNIKGKKERRRRRS